MNRNQLLLSELLYDTCGADLVEYGLIAVALLLTVAAAASSTTARLVTEVNILEILAATCSLTALVGFVLPLSAAVKGH
jgi:Flp pilus assembly pilin Flp